MADGHLGTRGTVIGDMQLGWVPILEEWILGIGTPTLYYRLEDPSGSTTTADLTAARPGAYSGTVTLDVYGPSGGAVSLASSAYINSTTSPLNIATGTIAFWCKFAAYPSSNTLLLGFIDSGSIFDKTFVLSSAGTLTFTANDGSNHTISSTNFPLGRWNQVAVTLSGTLATLYINGSSVGTVSCGNSLSSYTSTTNLYIGSGSGSAASATFPGNLAGSYDDVAIWNSLVVTSQQINGMYLAGIEVLTSTNAKVSKEVVEVAYSGTPNAKVTKEVVEVAHTGTPSARVTKLLVEVLRQSAIGNFESITDTLTFTPTVVDTKSSGDVSQTLVFTQTVGLLEVHKPSLSQTLVFTQTVSAFGTHTLNVLQTLSFTQTTTRVAGTINITVPDFLSFTQTPALQHSEVLLQLLNLVETVGINKTVGDTQSLVFTETTLHPTIFHRAFSDTLTFTQIVRSTRPERVSQTLVMSQSSNLGLGVNPTCDSGSLGDNALGNFTLGTDCGPGGPNGFSIDTFNFTETLTLGKIRHRTILDVLSFSETIIEGPFVRNHQITDIFSFYEGFYPRTFNIGTGTTTTVTQPVATGTVVTQTTILQTANGVIVLPPARFDDSLGLNNKVNLLKVMSTKAFTYVKSSTRLTLKYEFLLGRQTSLQLRAFYEQNPDTIITLTNWKGEIYLVQFGKNPMELTTTGRFQNEYESVIANLEFEGVRANG